MKFVVSLLCLFMFKYALALESEAEVILLRGAATYESETLRVGSKIRGLGVISVLDRSYLKLRFLPSNHTVVVGANSSAKLDLLSGENREKVQFLSGAFRWVTGKYFKKSGINLYTKNAVFGLRGTDFSVVFNPVLEESEMVCNAGEVKFFNLLDESNSRIIRSGQWGGLGGRFGKRIWNILTLNKKGLDYFNSPIPLD